MAQQVLAESEETVALLRERLLGVVGQHGQLLVDVIPSLELLIGEQPAVELDLGMSEMQSLYTQLFTRLVDVFSRYERVCHAARDDVVATLTCPHDTTVSSPTTRW
jgi:predicted ATPase